MKTLRIHLSRPWHAADAVAWSLVDDAANDVRAGRGPAAQWPAHDRLEAVIAAEQVRLVALDLPPMPLARRAAAARFAIEDQIAGSDAGVQVVVAPPAGPRTVAVVCPRSILESLVPRSGPLERLVRVSAEPEACPPAVEWQWCTTGPAGEGFVRLPDGAAFATSRRPADGTLPAELALALAQAPAASVPTVHVRGPAQPEDLARWHAATGVAFHTAPAWDWQDPPRDGAPTDLLQGDFGLDGAPSRPRLARVFSPALILLGTALAVHVLATLGTWIALRVDLARTDAAWTSLGLAAGLPAQGLSSRETIEATLSARHAASMHARHRFVRSDALPLLARVAPAIAMLPAGAVKRAVYGDAHWTFELQGVDGATLQRFDTALRATELEALVVAIPGGARVRTGWR